MERWYGRVALSRVPGFSAAAGEVGGVGMNLEPVEAVEDSIGLKPGGNGIGLGVTACPTKPLLLVVLV